jgi:hypothetical protein
MRCNPRYAMLLDRRPGAYPHRDCDDFRQYSNSPVAAPNRTPERDQGKCILFAMVDAGDNGELLIICEYRFEIRSLYARFQVPDK